MLKELENLEDYILVVSEKPDAGRRIANALNDDKVISLKMDNVPIHIVKNDMETYVICSASGHLYAVGDPSQRRTSYPVFDLEWYPIHLVSKGYERAEKIIKVIEKLSKKASGFFHACDFDLEGETIGYNILKYACGGVEKEAVRAKFSTLTRGELRTAFKRGKPGIGINLAKAGRTRHVIDFIWGVNLSRALSEAYHAANNGYKTVSVGRVQGPTLSFLVDKEVEIQTFVPIPFWSIIAIVDKNEVKITARYEIDRIKTLDKGNKIKRECEGKQGIVNSIRKGSVRQCPPVPFNTGDLQRESYRVFGISPSQTLRIAERLYLNALISYPRTSSQKLPPSIGYKKILNGLRRIPEYTRDVDELVKGKMIPHEGGKYDPAHPAIYPTGEVVRRSFNSMENKIFNLIVRRFLAAFGEELLRESISATIAIANHNFKVFGSRTVKKGWQKYYKMYSGIEENPLPVMGEGELVTVETVNLYEKWTQPPHRYNQSSLLELMEKIEIGTKSTRADVISTLYERGYLTGQSMVTTDMGFTVVETLRRHSPDILSTEMTRDVEANLAEIECGKLREHELIEKTVEKVLDSLKEMKEKDVTIGKELKEASIETIRLQNNLGKCPICKYGKLRIIRSKRTGKRFVGCSRYSDGCRASSPLPQRGSLKTTTKVCDHCNWPIIYVRTTRRPWRLCVNIDCSEKKRKEKNLEVQTVQKR